MTTILTAQSLFDGVSLIDDPVLAIEDGYITSISSRASRTLPTGAQVLDFPGTTLSPAFFDVHIHGAAGHDVMEATPQALATIGKFLAKHGVGSYLATTVTAPLDTTLRAVERLAKLIARPPVMGRAQPLGIHLEGPFLSNAKCGAQPAEYLQAPSIDIFDKLFDAADGQMRLITLAPELPGALELIAHASRRGVQVSLGHSIATAAETRAAIAAGAVSSTHTFNAMRALDHREAGILGTVLTSNSLYAELICDGIHSQPEMTRLWWCAKGADRGVLVTDAMSATGMPDGEYQLGGFSVEVAQGRAMSHGVLAGSVLTLDRALSNFITFTGASVAQGLRLLTVNPATMTGLQGQIGSLSIGRPANLVAVSAEGKLVASFFNGHSITASPSA